MGSALHKPAPVCLLTTTGRKTGKSHTTPLLYLQRGTEIVVVASQGGRAHNPAWYLNLQATPTVTIDVGRRRGSYLAHTASDTEREELWPALVDMYADFATYDSWTERTIPIVVCVPA